MSGPQVITLGCRLNIAESEAMRQANAQDDGLIIINSCAVTAEAVRQTRQAVRRAHRARPDARIVVTGCAAQTDPAMFSAMTEVSAVVGNHDKLRTGALDPDGERVRVADVMESDDLAPHLTHAFADRVRAFVVIQNGCDHRCTFCIIPFGRGNSRSVPAGGIIDQIKLLVDEGVQEVVLTGVDVTSYGADLPGKPTLGLLVERILKSVPALPRLRLSSLDSVEMDDRLIELVTGDARLMPHIHLSLQAGNDMILKRMKRRHGRSDAIALVDRLRRGRPHIAIGADIIAGFPTESEDMFQDSLALIAECRIVHGHIFPYSPREGTPAARMPQVRPEVVKERAARLRAACNTERSTWLNSLVGTHLAVLVETSGLTGHSEAFAPVRFATAQTAGSIISVRAETLENDALVAHGNTHG